MVSREAHHAFIEILENQRALADSEADRDRLGLDIVQESTHFRVLTSLTAILVLDSEEQVCLFVCLFFFFKKMLIFELIFLKKIIIV